MIINFFLRKITHNLDYSIIYVCFGQRDLFDHQSLVRAIKQVDVVISTVGHDQLGDQIKIIAAIREAGNVKVTIHKPYNLV